MPNIDELNQDQIAKAKLLKLTPEFVQASFDAGLTFEQITLLAEWNQAKANVEYWKEEELRMRKLVAHSGITENNEGTNRAAIGGGMEVKTVIKINYKLDPDVKKVQKALAKLPEHVADSLVTWKPNFYPGEYKKLEGRHLQIMQEIVTTDEGAPTVEIVKAAKR